MTSCEECSAMASISWRRIRRTPVAWVDVGQAVAVEQLADRLGPHAEDAARLGDRDPVGVGVMEVPPPVVVEAGGRLHLAGRDGTTVQETGCFFGGATQDGHEVEPPGHAEHRMPPAASGLQEKFNWS
jgi:hypothetical protein